MAPGPAALRRSLARRLAPLLACVAACVEIDPSYGDSYATTSTGSAAEGLGSTESSGTTNASASDDAGSGSGSVACDCGPLELCESGTCAAPARVLFVNLDGATTTFGNADASQDVEGLYPELAGRWAPYAGDEATRQMLLSLVEAQWAPFRVVVTATRPPAGPYLMAVVTSSPSPASLESPVFVAFPDCGEAIAQDVAFVFAAPGDGFGVAGHARFVSAALGRGLGLRYSDADDDIMGFGDRFVDGCRPSSDAPCTAHHPELCPEDPTQQNSYGELAALLGVRD